MATQKVLAKDLDLKVKVPEKKTYQQDGCVRVEATLEQETYANIEGIKELISHQYPNATLSEVVDFLANHFLDLKDPLRKASKITTAPVPASRQKSNAARVKEAVSTKKAVPVNKAIPVKIRVEVFKRDQCCQWVETVKNNKGDHIKSRWQDGSNNLENLQLLCAVHNKHKFKNEILDKI